MDLNEATKLAANEAAQKAPLGRGLEGTQTSSEIMAEMSRLLEEINQLENVTGRLEMKIVNVMRPVEPRPEEADKEVESRVPLAEAISRMRQQIFQVNQRLIDMGDRVEL